MSDMERFFKLWFGAATLPRSRPGLLTKSGPRADRASVGGFGSYCGGVIAIAA